MRQMIAGNWKMHGTEGNLEELREVAERRPSSVDVALCLPATLITKGSDFGENIIIGGQDCHAEEKGAYTGDISAEMLRSAGARIVIVGHSERRADHHETNQIVRGKAEAAHRAGLVAIVCVGETDEEREAGRTMNVIAAQVTGSVPDGSTAENTVIAYEPVWAIGTGKSASAEDVRAAHAQVRSALKDRIGSAGERVRVLYGGSVKPGNAAELLAVEGVDGALVGGASLKASDFLAICDAAKH